MSTRAFKTLFGLGPWRRGQDLLLVIEKHGIETFNAVRSRNPQWQPDLSESDLRGMDLSRANLKNVKLIGAHVDGIIVDGLELSGERALRTLARRGAIVEIIE